MDVKTEVKRKYTISMDDEQAAGLRKILFDATQHFLRIDDRPTVYTDHQWEAIQHLIHCLPIQEGAQQ